MKRTVCKSFREGKRGAKGVWKGIFNQGTKEI